MAYVECTLLDADFIACNDCHSRILRGQDYYSDEETDHTICPQCLGVVIDHGYDHGCEG